MSVSKIIHKVSILIIVAFGFLGAFTFSIVLHELSHYQDLHRYSVHGDDFLCFLGISPTNITDSGVGYYSYTYYPNPEITQVQGYTEFKAYTIQAIMFLLFLLAIVKYYIYHKELKLTNKLLQYELENR